MATKIERQRAVILVWGIDNRTAAAAGATGKESARGVVKVSAPAHLNSCCHLEVLGGAERALHTVRPPVEFGAAMSKPGLNPPSATKFRRCEWGCFVCAFWVDRIESTGSARPLVSPPPPRSPNTGGPPHRPAASNRSTDSVADSATQPPLRRAPLRRLVHMASQFSPQEEAQFEEVLLGLAARHGGIEPLLRTFFAFLHRKTVRRRVEWFGFGVGRR